MDARPARAGVGGASCRAIAGGRTMTISPDLACMCIGNTERHHWTACSCVLSRPLSRPLECGLWAGIRVSGGGQLACCSQCTQQRGASHWACFVLIVQCVGVLELSVLSPAPLRRRSSRRSAGSARSGAPVCVGACIRLYASECPAPAHVSLACSYMRADFVRPADRMVEHKALFVCVSGLSFRGEWSISVAGVSWCSGQTSATPSLRGHVSGFCMHEPVFLAKGIVLKHSLSRIQG